VKGLVPVAMISIGRGRPREHPPSISRGSPMGDDVTSGQKAPLGRILRRFRLRRRTQFHRMDIAQLSVSHAHTQRNPEGIT
jgi:hypothetical protein